VRTVLPLSEMIYSGAESNGEKLYMTKAEDRILVQEHLAHAAEPKPLSAEEKARLENRIKAVLKEKDAVLVAHYYTDPDIQRLAEESGGCVADSLEMARFGNKQAEQPARTECAAVGPG